ncbi:MAG TPA: tRNA (N6-threonylcarbamoyladenosine(37)-N6)-methyltransferase TrmO [Methanoculleus sp.]|jgi:tRNA-Thr(GGU) m(6)t(6)A37 methyltransferase TsaA|uniref:tRNA (N6-threonylcarbamoyladenosine(37)-N6)-methyltransferase TrmO n=1 Tax=Methanoculleus sp. TaxID=90427 RepID=UPI001B7857EC|nr:tRNA (N6-threonylcarbamoyladenosine(37)-N6)-methyltransferase TrmO [Methanoculleus sp.]MBP7143675.1 tRNA (N6-threonylcarbamoyladenosine(37)-N6)-methyltransferase TrmO [Methanoculleus sp.]HNV37902.1 tRNA (N6-threonylcarbamoyladenosine(37)-N6)-methyltransferase TrmO [Methanoculleus sp.]HOC83081.1 tRNA (N6-threonylcarbamoyladenosine(37)-N6)-methyltransferase TrmO [Methanoculleus sp.]HOF96493.1 tRNA (N6-threonylcarbamoyladenosine(37)-N6)-methyltransferase TrmO [Methanoculleus sp.]HOI60780.1 tRN
MIVDLNPIGHVSSPYKEKKDAPRQGRLTDTEATIVIDDHYLPALFRVEEKKHLFVLCWFDRADRTALRATPPHNPVEHGVFATRSPNRPNPISLSLVDVIDITGNTIRVRGLEALDGTPVLDIKPYSREIDCPE